MKTWFKVLFSISVIMAILFSIGCSGGGNNTPTPTADNATPTPTATSNETAGDPYDMPEVPILWISISPTPAVFGQEITVVLKVPPGATCDIDTQYYDGFVSAKYKPPTTVADASGDVTMKWTPGATTKKPGSGFIKLTVTLADMSAQYKINHPFEIINP